MSKFACNVDTPVGNFYLIIDGDTVIKSGFGKPTTALPVVNHKYQDLIKAYFNGNKKALSDIKTHQTGSIFISKVWQEMAKIPAGKTVSYKDLAKKAGNEKATRATGSSCAKNQIPLIIPCHRVIKSDGSIGSYAYGSKIKKFLLDHESAL